MAGAVAAPRRNTSAVHRARPDLVAAAPTAVLLFALALALRLISLRSAYDVFIDESIYSGIANNIAVGKGLTFEGQVSFYLHPPLLFFLDAGWLRLIGKAGSEPVQLVFACRVLEVTFGAVNAVLVWALVRRLVGSRPALLAGLAYALEPFVVRFDSRVFLEAPTTTFLLAGFLTAAPLAERPGGSRRRVAAGLLFGLALLTKEPSAVLFGVPLLVCLVRDRPLSRRDSSTMLLTAALTYLPYPLIATIFDGSQWFDQKTVGVRRLLGLVQESGFNQDGAPSFTGRLIAQLPYFGATYAVIGLGLLAGGYILRTRPPVQQLAALWSLSAFALLFYQVALGTLEEQMFYFLVVPAMMTIAVALSGLVADTSPSRVWRTAGVLVLATYYVVIGAVWVRVHTTPDDEVARTVAWVDAHVPAGSPVQALADGTQLVLPRQRVSTALDLSATSETWVITSSLQAEQGYGFANRADLRALAAQATPVFTATGRSMGRLTVWRLGR